MALTDAERIDVRRYCGYAMFGNSSSGYQGYRFFTAYGTMEYRMTNATDNEIIQIRNLLAKISTADDAIVSSADNMDTDSAAVWVHNKNEVRERIEFFDYWRDRLCRFFGIPHGPDFGDSSNTRAIVV